MDGDLSKLEVLVSLDLRDRRAGVIHEEGRHLLCPSLENGGGREVGTETVTVGVGDGQVLIGGLLPAGAVTAEVVDLHGRRFAARTGKGAWIALLEKPLRRMRRNNPVCFRDGSGELVRPQLPDTWARRPVEDADRVCPACGGRSWEEVIPSDGSRGMRSHDGGDMEPMPIVVCCSCGFEEIVGSWATMRAVPVSGDEDRRRQVEAFRKQAHERRRQALAKVGFPIYVDAGRPAQLSGWGGGDEGIESVTVSDAGPRPDREKALKIDTALSETRPADEQAILRGEMENWLIRPMLATPEGLSEPARALAWRAADRERQRQASEANVGVRTIDVDGKDEQFAFAEHGERWVAARRGEKLTIVISGAGIDPGAVRLVQVKDPLAELLRER